MPKSQVCAVSADDLFANMSNRNLNDSVLVRHICALPRDTNMAAESNVNIWCLVSRRK